MSNLSSPTVKEPIYECAATVIVSGYVPGATIAIYAEPPAAGPAVQIGGGVSNSASGQVFGVASANMLAGAKITAVQTYDNSTSPPSPEVVVQVALSVDAPVLTQPLFECARCVRVGGLLPGVKVEVRDAGNTLGHNSAASANVSVGVSPQFAAGHTINARQLYCGNPGPDSTGIKVGAAKELRVQLAPPEVASPLFACQQSCVIEGCMPGCEVELLENGAPKSAGCVSGTAVARGVGGGLVQGKSMTARQSLCGGAIQSLMSAAVVVQPASDIPKPVVWPPLYEGDTSVLVGMTVAGEVVSIAADGSEIGMGGGGGGTALLNVAPPLVAGQKVVATVELCGVKKHSLPVTVLPAPKNVPPPKVVKPLNACSLLVNVTDCIPGAEVRVYATSGANTVLLGLTKTLTSATTVWTTPPLKAGWSVHATQKVGEITSGPSAAVIVSAPPAAIPKPKLVTPIAACSRCVRLEQLIVGARVDVYQNNVWVGGADAAGATAHVPVYPGLSAGATVTATQTVCGKVSDADKVTVAPASDKVPAPKLQPAFANKSYVVATNLLVGAIVEVEEVSVYKQVVGKACAHSTSQAIGLNIPLFAGARLRARQKLCATGPYSKTIDVAQPEEWPLGAGAFKAGSRLVTDVPVSADISFLGSSSGPCNGGDYDFVRPATNKAVIFYPAASEGQGAPLAGGGPFPVVVFGHGRRWPSCLSAWEACPGAPEDIKEDYRNFSGVLSHLARWGFVCIAPDFSWLASQFSVGDWVIALADAATYLIAENTKPGSPLEGKLKTGAISLMGHSTGGFAAVELAVSGQFTVDALGLLAPAGGSGSVFNFAPNPVMVLRGTHDTGPFGDGGQSANIYAAAGPKKHSVTIEGANHFGFTDSLCILADPAADISQADQQKIAKAYLTAFLRRYVSGALEVENYLTGAQQVEELEAFFITVDAQI